MVDSVTVQCDVFLIRVRKGSLWGRLPRNSNAYPSQQPTYFAISMTPGLATPPSATRAKPPYPTARVYLHWLSALVILWATVSGFGVTLLPASHPLRQWVEGFNPVLTSLFIPFFVGRLWLYMKASPHRTDRQPGLQEKIAAITHGTLYLCVAGVLLTGVLMMTHPVVLIATLALPQLVHSASALANLQLLHHGLCALLAVLIGLHVAAVIQHQIKGRSVLYRMR